MSGREASLRCAGWCLVDTFMALSRGTSWCDRRFTAAPTKLSGMRGSSQEKAVVCSSGFHQSSGTRWVRGAAGLGLCTPGAAGGPACGGVWREGRRKGRSQLRPPSAPRVHDPRQPCPAGRPPVPRRALHPDSRGLEAREWHLLRRDRACFPGSETRRGASYLDSDEDREKCANSDISVRQAFRGTW